MLLHHCASPQGDGEFEFVLEMLAELLAQMAERTREALQALAAWRRASSGEDMTWEELYRAGQVRSACVRLCCVPHRVIAASARRSGRLSLIPSSHRCAHVCVCVAAMLVRRQAIWMCGDILKGSARQMFLNPLGDAAEAVERACRGCDGSHTRVEGAC